MTRMQGKHTGNNDDTTSWTLTSYEGKGGAGNRKCAFNFRKFFGGDIGLFILGIFSGLFLSFQERKSSAYTSR